MVSAGPHNKGEFMINNTMTRRGMLGLAGAGLLAGIVAAPADTAEAAGVARWNRPTVHVVNLLGTAWPVNVAAEAWDNSSSLDLVTVTSINYRVSNIIVRFGRLPSGVLGRCATARDGLGRYKAATVTINDRITGSYPYGSKVLLVRHEIGHALGFNHTSKRDVMNETISASGSPLLGWFHQDTLRRVYGS